MTKKAGRQLDSEIAEVLRKHPKHARKVDL